MNHTPGPWRFEVRTEYPNGHVNGIWGANDEEIVVTDSGYYPPTIDDARLIAAAPELLAALKAILAALPFDEYCDCCGDFECPENHACEKCKSRHLIAKAEGR